MLDQRRPVHRLLGGELARPDPECVAGADAGADADADADGDVDVDADADAQAGADEGDGEPATPVGGCGYVAVGSSPR